MSLWSVGSKGVTHEPVSSTEKHGVDTTNTAPVQGGGRSRGGPMMTFNELEVRTKVAYDLGVVRATQQLARVLSVLSVGLALLLVVQGKLAVHLGNHSVTLAVDQTWPPWLAGLVFLLFVSWVFADVIVGLIRRAVSARE